MYYKLFIDLVKQLLTRIRKFLRRKRLRIHGEPSSGLTGQRFRFVTKTKPGTIP